MTRACAIAVVLLAGAPALADDATPRPNVVLIVVDDLGFSDPACYGNTYHQTPAIDKLASQGMRFTSAYVAAPNCTPSRSSLLSGWSAGRTGCFTVGPSNNDGGAEGEHLRLVPPKNESLADGVVTLPQTLRDAGYATGFYGKWHVRGSPAQRGFTEAVDTISRHHGFLAKHPGKTDDGRYHADWVADESIAFIGRHKDEPFFLMASYFAVHEPLIAPDDLVAEFRDRPDAPAHANAVYAAMLKSVDDNTGRILAALDEHALTDRTIVVLMSDNGAVTTTYRGKGEPITTNAPLRAEKSTLYEGGLRVPMIVRWPGVVDGGAVCDQPVSALDLYPTIAAAAHVSPVASHPLDGVALMALLHSSGRAALAERALYWHLPCYLRFWHTTPCGAIRQGDYKLIEFFEGRVELYNLAEDIGETRDLSAQMPEKAAELRGKLAAWRESVGAAMPTANPAFDAEQEKRWYASRKSNQPRKDRKPDEPNAD